MKNVLEKDVIEKNLRNVQRSFFKASCLQFGVRIFFEFSRRGSSMDNPERSNQARKKCNNIIYKNPKSSHFLIF